MRWSGYNEAGLMGAYGCALHARDQHHKGPTAKVLPSHSHNLEHFTHRTKTTYCKGCTNNCLLTINIFDEGRKLVSGNKCDRIVSPDTFINNPEQLNIYAFKQQYLAHLKPIKGERGRIGLPLQLNFYEQLPFWHTFFSHLGFEVVVSSPSTRETYLKGQSTISSDTICYPAKLMHGHIKALLEKQVPAIFYPCSSYNIDEEKGDNHFNCPVVAYYPEVLRHNISELQDGSVTFISDYLSLADRAFLPKRMYQVLSQYYPVKKQEIRAAVKAGYASLEDLPESHQGTGETHH
nr:acyl-CoA dehydratase activase-related protein [uncultured Sphaerochaeta sp.]